MPEPKVASFPAIRGALKFYQIASIITGIMLLLLLVEMVLKYTPIHLELFVAAVQEKGIPVTIAAEGGADLNAGSILSLMGLGAAKGTVVTLKSDAEGAEQALDELVALLETDLDAE